MSELRIHKKIAAMAQKDALLFGDKRYLQVMSLLARKGLIFFTGEVAEPQKKVSIHDLLWVGEKIEPRVLEVLPALMVHFPNVVQNRVKLPEDLAEVLSALERGTDHGPDFRGVAYAKMRFWAEYQLPDKRIKPLSQKRKLRTYRLPIGVIRALTQKAKDAKISESDYLTRLINQSI